MVVPVLLDLVVGPGVKPVAPDGRRFRVCGRVELGEIGRDAVFPSRVSGRTRGQYPAHGSSPATTNLAVRSRKFCVNGGNSVYAVISK